MKRKNNYWHRPKDFAVHAGTAISNGDLVTMEDESCLLLALGMITKPSQKAMRFWQRLSLKGCTIGKI